MHISTIHFPYNVVDKQTKRVREVNIVDIDERDPRPPSRSMMDEIRPIGPDNRTHDHQRDTSPRGTGHEQHSPTNLVDQEQRGQCAKAVDDPVDAGSEKGALCDHISLVATLDISR